MNIPASALSTPFWEFRRVAQKAKRFLKTETLAFYSLLGVSQQTSLRIQRRYIYIAFYSLLGVSFGKSTTTTTRLSTLSTPFWEFQKVVKHGRTTALTDGTFYSLLGVSVSIKMREWSNLLLPQGLSTPFWEFPRELLKSWGDLLQKLFLLPFGSFHMIILSGEQHLCFH